MQSMQPEPQNLGGEEPFENVGEDVATESEDVFTRLSQGNNKKHRPNFSISGNTQPTGSFEGQIPVSSSTEDHKWKCFYTKDNSH